MSDSFLLTAIIFFPLLGAILVAVFPADDDHGKERARWITLITLILGFLISLGLWFGFNPEQQGMQFVQRADWIPGLGIEYYIGVDGLSLLLIMLTTFLGPLVMAGSWTAIQDRVKGFCFALLLLQTAMLGTFMALDIFLFYVFWELMLLPLYFIIGIWGGARRIYAAIKLFVYTMTGSLVMLIAVLYLALTYNTFDLLELYRADIPAQAQLWLFGFFALAFAIKVPMFPFHTWLPDAHVEAPTAGSVILAGVLLKMGTYGFMRFAMPLFPEAIPAYSPIVCVLAIIGIIYGALVAMVQPDVKKLVAYSSVSHLGFVMLGLFALNPQGVQGGILQMVNHGISTGALFILVGMIYERRHTRMIKDFGGLAKVMPVYSFFFMMITFSSVGLPGLNGFIGEMLILLGAFEFNPIYAILAATGVILGAIYMLWMYRRVFFGPVTHEENKDLKDLNGREIVIMSALMIFVIWIGVYPASFLGPIAGSVETFIEQSERTRTITIDARSPGRDSGAARDDDQGRAGPRRRPGPRPRLRGPGRRDRGIRPGRPGRGRGLRPGQGRGPRTGRGRGRRPGKAALPPSDAVKRLRGGRGPGGRGQGRGGRGRGRGEGDAPAPPPSLKRPTGGGRPPAGHDAPNLPAPERRTP